MANEKELKQINKHAILVHQLLPENKNSALSYFSIDSIEKVSYDSDGLQIFFKEYDLVVKSILRRKIEVEGSFYKIYPKVTNLTVVGIGPYATNSEIEGIMLYYGFIIDSYRIQETVEENGYKTVSLTNDYRIILDIPEVFAPKLRPIKLPDIGNKTFEVLFFCRFCRNNGHMQFQCPKVVKSSPSSFRCYQNTDVSRTSYKNDSSDLVTNKDRISCPQSDFCVNKRNSKTYPDYQMKIEKKQNYFLDQNFYSKNSSDSACSTYHQNMDVSRRMSCEKDSGDSIIGKNASNSSQSDFCVDKRNSKTRLNSHEKIEKKQKHFPGQGSYSKNSSNSSSSTYHQNMDVSRRTSCEKDSGDSITRKNESNSSQSDFCVDKRNSKSRLNYHEKIAKEQNYLPDQSFYSENSSNSSSSTYHQNMHVCGRISCKKDSEDLVVRKNASNSSQSDFCVDKRNSKTRLNSHEKIEKEQKHFPGQSSYSKNSSNSSSSTYHQNMDVSRRTSCEKDSGDSIIRKNASNSRQSDFCVDKRNSRTRLNYHEKIKKEQDYFPGQSCNSENSPNSSSSTQRQNMDVSRRMSCEKDSGDSVIRKNASNSRQSDFCVNKRNCKTRPNSHMKIEKGQNYFPDQNCYSKNSFHSSSSTYHQSMDVSRKISCENNSGDSIIDNPASDFCVNKRNFKTRPKPHVEIEKEYFSDQSSCSKNSFHSSSSTYHQTTHVSRRTSCENDSGDLIIDNNEIDNPASVFCVNKRNFKTRSNPHSEIEKEQQHYFSDQSSCSKNSFHSSSSTYHQSTDVSRRISCENDSVDLIIDNNEIDNPASDFSVNRRNSKNHPDAHGKTGKEQNYFSDQNCCYRNKSHKNDILKSSYIKSTHSKPKNFYNRHQIADNVKISEKHRKGKVSSMPTDADEKCKDNNSPAFKEQSIENFGKGTEKRNVEQHCENEEAGERIQASTSNECSNKRTFATNSKRKKENKKFMHLLSSLLPPNMDLLETKKLIDIALKCDSKDIPEEVKDVLVIILKYNSGVNRKICNKAARIVLNWVEAVLSKIMKQEKFQRENSFKDPVKHPTKENEHGEDEKSATGIPKEQSPGKRKVTLSLGIREAISKTSGELEPTFLCNFLNQVRGRRKLFEVASVFTENIPALVSQLAEVQNTYYKYVQKRGPEEDRDIHYIKRLRLRLQQHSGNATDVALEREVSMAEVSSETESDMIEVPVKTESDITEVSVKTESDMTEMSVKRESDMTETFVKTYSNMTEMSVKESDIAEISVKTESDRTKTFVKTESDVTEISVETESDMREIYVKREAEISVKRETELFMRQSSSSEEFLGKDLSSYCLHGASYFTNITQMPFSFTSIKPEVNYID